MGGLFSSLTNILIFSGVLIAVVISLIGYCCWKFTDDAEDERRQRTERLMENLLRREDLDGTFVGEDGKDVWQCVVCAYTNGAGRKTCLMCGTNMTFFMSRALKRHASSGTLLGNEDNEEAEEKLRARQRALFKRRMNSMATRQNLTQRQRGAFRRRIWTRKEDPEGKFHWIRMDSTDGMADTVTSFTTMNNNSFMKMGPNGEKVADIHLKSQGFVWQYDECGRLQWKEADQVAIDMDSFEDMSKVFKKDEHIDLEGIMALDFRRKKQWFLVHLARIATPITESVSKLTIERDNMLEASMSMINACSSHELHTYLKITFAGEPGIDAGGLLREWFGLITKELFSEKLGLFIPTKGEDMSYWINPLSGENNPKHLEYFRFVGILVGKALFEGLVLDVHLALPLMKHILGIPISFSDLEFLDEDLHRNCKWLKENNQVEDLCLTFSVMLENGQEVDLKEDGRNIDVTDENKEEYLRLVLHHRMLSSISDQLQEFLTGLYEVVPKTLLSVFDYQELELMLCGIPTIDVADWKANTTIRHVRDEENKNKKINKEEQERVLEWYWSVIDSLTPEERARILQFATGTSRVPVEGFKGLTSSSGIIHPFTIQLVPRGKDPSSLFPKAHTCFNRIDLPLYRDREELETYLSIVFEMEILGFGLE
ncbi:hypothetical protein Poli38472_008665 [Pythium oligandrum]|uniref:HECT-type E3 ubiquitin transferase n=1 Tax=Pythium oligandrum TaxID=41045 RepID=A0A8K1C3X9_PYTOL|nr:hypothetical protein Poli38472_008665 [Pythium oligandrum]|eukprot:TMW56017.1 hypothetical protein Poli38472_008665 [Pythium oligandrum]